MTHRFHRIRVSSRSCTADSLPIVRVWLLVVAPVVCATSCTQARRSDRQCDVPEVRTVVEQFGGRLQQVSLLAPDSIVARQLRKAYAPIVTTELLATWTANPAGAPGRSVSSPWPARIEVRSAQPTSATGCRVDGEVLYVTSADSAKVEATRRQGVTLHLVANDGEWRISGYEPVASPGSDSSSPNSAATSSSSSSDAAEAADVVRQYYAAIARKDYRSAYALWGDDGAASGKTLAEFGAGFRETVRVKATIGTPGRVEPAAGSRYVDVPVVIHATTASAKAEQYDGTYVLRRSVVDGATPQQRRWHIYVAKLTPVR